ncbi:TOG array regulator of axonemal microtubules protein 1 [Herrania umbratica]|uniref:TOG array regulator of axonemal microtubules protein 1 n=1 Tax=Herrania umbratica TaxID=108875 RepID=A0A6J1ATJ7_9ROSI|nr:TOG array regulator of axonemal microtubules protein 1 [Herrania umbratica]
MALRPIDNALPITPERPKKQAKVSVPVQKKPSEFGVNDENKAPLPPSADASVDYIPSENLKPFQDPESFIQSLIEGLDSKDWVKLCESLNDARRFSLYHSNLLLPILEKVILVVVKAMKNPRSALCKTSIMAASDIFNAFDEKLLDSTDSGAFDQLLLQLLLKASQDKKFVCEEADRSLNAMVKSMAPLPLLQKLRGYVNHGNLRVRAKAAVSISNSVLKMGLEEIKEFGMVTLLQMAADLLNDRLPEAREAARSIVFSLYKAFRENEEEIEEEAWQSFCQTNLPPNHAQSMVKVTLSSRV